MADMSGSLSALQREHADAFKEALIRTLSTEVAESTYAEILDGLLTEDSFLEFNLRKKGNPVFALNHTSLCPGTIERIRDFRAKLDPLTLSFPLPLLSAFNQTHPGTQRYELRLIELLAVACHQIAVNLYNLDDGVHKHWVYQDWRDSVASSQYVAPTPFYHRNYLADGQYPNGVADIVGYWAEAKIFGGVVIFDRGESGTECRDVFLHDGRFNGPRTIYPPTPRQYDALIDFLLGPRPSDGSGCPIPILATAENRWRYDPWDSMTRFNIFRDRYERRNPPPSTRRRHCVRSSVDWPELGDEHLILMYQHEASEGKPLNQAGIDEAVQRMRQITPSSPLWSPYWDSGPP